MPHLEHTVYELTPTVCSNGTVQVNVVVDPSPLNCCTAGVENMRLQVLPSIGIR